MTDAPKNLYALNAPFLPAANKGPRTTHFAKHMENIGPLIASGEIFLGVGLLPQDKTTATGDFTSEATGAILLIRAESLEWVRNVVERDIYWTSGEVWDREKITIEPMILFPGSNISQLTTE